MRTAPVPNRWPPDRVKKMSELESELELIKHEGNEKYRTTYELRMCYRQAGEEHHETIEDGLTEGDLWSRLYRFHRQLAREEPEKLADWHREKLGIENDE